VYRDRAEGRTCPRRRELPLPGELLMTRSASSVRLPLQGLTQLALRLREAAFEISNASCHRGRFMCSRLDAEELKFYAMPGNGSMV
jgi:hypothetical protein